jgi:hypothetical protein
VTDTAPLTNPPTVILAAERWRTNGDLISAALELHAPAVATRYRLPVHELDVVDVTWGRGRWWTRTRPPRLVAHDLNLDGVDFTALPEADGTYHVAAYDPPYVAVGGRATSTLPDFLDRYGLVDAPKGPALLQHGLINPGLAEVHRVLKPGGIALVKCQDYVSSGHLWLGTHWTLTHALNLGFTCTDRIEHLGHARAQPAGRTRKCGACNGRGHLKSRHRDPILTPCTACGTTGRTDTRQHHARRNLSTLFVLTKKAAR